MKITLSFPEGGRIDLVQEIKRLAKKSNCKVKDIAEANLMHHQKFVQLTIRDTAGKYVSNVAL